ncbi:recombinase RecT [Xylophilus sp. GOD-11R]|nr:recombinase RecT [Xylophilus sp. GOD-11R]WPB58606.1 recombinase RecT [Xylophilus sp. GOD-11R]
MEDETGCGIRIWATLRGEDQPRTLELLLAQARVRNSTLWADDPKQQLAYLAQKRWSRLYAPDVILGVYSPDEITAPGETFMGMADLVGAPPPPPAQPAREAWPDDAFKKRLPKWQASIDKGTSAEEIIDFVESKSVLSEEQKAMIRALKPTTVAEPKTAVTFAQVADGIRLATNLEQLSQAAELIGEVADPEQRKELTALHDARQFDLT